MGSTAFWTLLIGCTYKTSMSCEQAQLSDKDFVQFLGQLKTVDSRAGPIRVSHVFLTRPTGLLGRYGSHRPPGPIQSRKTDCTDVLQLYVILTGPLWVPVCALYRTFSDFVTMWPTKTMNAYKLSICISPQHHRRLILYDACSIGLYCFTRLRIKSHSWVSCGISLLDIHLGKKKRERERERQRERDRERERERERERDRDREKYRQNKGNI